MGFPLKIGDEVGHHCSLKICAVLKSVIPPKINIQIQKIVTQDQNTVPIAMEYMTQNTCDIIGKCSKSSAVSKTIISTKL